MRAGIDEKNQNKYLLMMMISSTAGVVTTLWRAQLRIDDGYNPSLPVFQSFIGETEIAPTEHTEDHRSLVLGGAKKPSLFAPFVDYVGHAPRPSNKDC